MCCIYSGKCLHTLSQSRCGRSRCYICKCVAELVNEALVHSCTSSHFQALTGYWSNKNNSTRVRQTCLSRHVCLLRPASVCFVFFFVLIEGFEIQFEGFRSLIYMFGHCCFLQALFLWCGDFQSREHIQFGSILFYPTVDSPLDAY